MGQPEFDITIGKDGKVKVRVQGVHGPECVELADLLRDIIGKEDSRQLTAEYYGPGTKVRMNVQARNRTTGR